ncbi:MAG: arginine--tRNA ligase [Flavitalea sp.]
MGIVSVIQSVVASEIGTLYNIQVSEKDVLVNETKPEFEGDYTVVLFTLVKALKKAPEAIGQELGEALVKANPSLFPSYNVIKGFLNLSIGNDYWLTFLQEHHNREDYGFSIPTGKKIMVEYSSPNTNKPLHLGHLRNNFLGWSIAEIFKANGNDTIKTAIVNDRGVHICKSMLAWQKFGNGATPAITGIKGDHLVGDYYVQFENELKLQTAPILNQIAEGDLTGFNSDDSTKLELLNAKLADATLPADKKAGLSDEIREIARNNTPIMKEVREMLLNWEKGEPETMNLWRQMNGWVYEGFDETYKKIGSDFDKIYYESGTYLLGKKFVEQGLESGVFIKKADGSVWIDLTSDGLDEKLLLRRDGTSVYITQDMGLAMQKYEEYGIDKSIYVIGDEQNYHMKVLKLICQKLNIPNSDNIHHLSYGMVELPTGRMKSREGTVVDADDIVKEMEEIAARHTMELGKVKDFTEEELKDLYTMIGLGALKFFLLRVDPKKRMIFNPEESIDFHGFTGPFIQYTYARTKSILRKETPAHEILTGSLLPAEKKVLVELEKYADVLEQAMNEMNPSVIANYIFRIAQTFNSLISELRILTAETPEKKELRLQMAQMTTNVIKSAMGLLGIRVPERM